MKTRKSNKKSGFSLLELLAVVTILGIIAAIIVPRVTVSSDASKEKVRNHHASTINSAVERYYVNKGTWPTLAAIGADADYFPDGIPKNPVTDTIYVLDATTHRIDKTHADWE